MSSFSAGARAALGAGRRPRAAVGFAITVVAVAWAASLERHLSHASAADHALTGAVFGLVLPLLAFAALGHVTGGRRLDLALWDVARWGGSRRAAAAGLLVTTGLALAGCGAVLACVAVAVARGAHDPLLGRDLATSAWVGLAGGACYASCFGFASGLGSKGGGRVAILLADWVLGSGGTALALPWPRGHLRNLLGAEPVLHMSQNAALVAIVVLTTAAGGFAIWRVPD